MKRQIDIAKKSKPPVVPIKKTIAPPPTPEPIVPPQVEEVKPSEMDLPRLDGGLAEPKSSKNLPLWPWALILLVAVIGMVFYLISQT